MNTIFNTINDKTTNPKGKVLYTITSETGMFYVGIAEKGTKRPLKDYTAGVKRLRNKTMRKTYKNGEIVGTRENWRDVHILLDSILNQGQDLTLTMVNVECESRQDLFNLERETLKDLMKSNGVHNTMNTEYTSAIIKELSK